MAIAIAIAIAIDIDIAIDILLIHIMNISCIYNEDLYGTGACMHAPTSCMLFTNKHIIQLHTYCVL